MPEFLERYAAARDGDSDARDWFAQRYRTELVFFLQHRAGAGARAVSDPDDVAHEAFLTFFERLNRFPSDLSEVELKSRLFQIAKWRLGDLFKQPRRELRQDSVSAFEPLSPEPSRGSVTREDDRRKLAELIGRLPEGYALVLESCLLDGNSVAETALRLGLSEENVYKRLARARARLDELAASWVASETERNRSGNEA